MTIPAVNRSESGAPGEREKEDDDGSRGRSPASRWIQVLRENLFEERDRWFLWLPVALGLGIGIYFSLAWEPPRHPTVALWSLLCLGCWLARRRPLLLALGIPALAAVTGFGAAQLRTASLEGPLIEKRTPPGLVTGTVVDVEPSGRRWRVVLETVEVERLEKHSTPRRVRIVLRHDDTPPEPGAPVSLTAVLMPLPRPAMPDAFDFARHAFFQGLGGVGYAISRVRIEGGDASAPLVTSSVAAARRAVGKRIVAALDDGSDSGLVRRSLADALLIGQRGAIPDQLAAAMRDSGLAHILAISGLHIGLVAGFVFFVVRAGLALVSPLALRQPIRKWAAGAALGVSFGYLLLAGATVPTQRAFLMLAIGLAAILADRFQINMRPVAWAALAILLVMPESLVGASFQLSFAAVVALVAAYEAVRARWRGIGIGAGFPRDPVRARASVIGLYFLAVAFTSAVAGIATAPLSMISFNRVAVYGLAANLAAVPITAFWVMPWGIVSLALMPFGLEAPALAAMALGLDVLAWVAREVAAWPGAVWLVPAVPVWSLVIVAFGGLWLTLWRRRWRLLGVPVALAGLIAGMQSEPPDVLLSGDGRLVAVRPTSEEIWVSSLSRAKFERGVWMQRLGLSRAVDWQSAAGDTDGSFTCDALGCVLRKGGAVVALPHDPRALHDDCAAADAVAAVVPVDRRSCGGASLVIDRFDLWRRGGHALWLEEDGSAAYRRTVRDGQGDRPWSVWPR